MDNTHGNVFLGVANGSACTMYSLAWDDPEDKNKASKAIAKGEPGQIIDLPTPPDHIIVDIKPKKYTMASLSKFITRFKCHSYTNWINNTMR